MKTIILYFTTMFFLIIALILHCTNNKEEENIFITNSFSTLTTSISTLVSTEMTTTSLVNDTYIYAVGAKFDLIPSTNYRTDYFYVTKYDFNGKEDISGWDKEYKTCGMWAAVAGAIDKNNMIYAGGVNLEVPSFGLGSSDYQSWIIRKYEPSGNEIASSVCSPFYKYPFTGGGDTAKDPQCPITSMAIDADDNIFATGLTLQNLSDGYGCTYRWEIIKIDQKGNTLWSRRFPTTAGNYLSPRLVIDNNSNVYAICNTSVDSGNSDWWIKKFDTNGVEDIINWNKIIDSGNDDPYNDVGVDTIASMAIDSQNNIYVFGEGCKLVSNDLNDLWIKKFDTNGVEDTINWNKKLYGGPTKSDPSCYRAGAIEIDTKNNVYTVSCQEDITQWIYIKKFTSDGVEIIEGWNKSLYLPIGVDFFGRSMATDKYDNVYVVYRDITACLYGFYSHIIKFNEYGEQDLSFTVSKCDMMFFNIKAGTI